MESIKQLREICQQTRDDEFYQSDWLDRNVLRRTSIYLTRLLLKAGFSPNKVTLLSLLPGLAAGALFTMPGAGYWLGGWGLFLLFDVLDCSDGEVARYQKSSSLAGEFNDAIAGFHFLMPFLFACMSFGLYRVLDNISVFILGFTLIICWVLYALSPDLFELILFRRKKRPRETDKAERQKASRNLAGKIISYGRIPFNQAGFFFALLGISLLDIFITPFLAGSFTLNVRFIYLALYALATVIGSLVRIYEINRYGAVKQR